MDEPTEEISSLAVGQTVDRFNGSETLAYLKGQSPMIPSFKSPTPGTSDQRQRWDPG
ncbi:MAG: hypothetical protein ACLQHS_11360 [Candidatus Limnocylindrales bacterium]